MSTADVSPDSIAVSMDQGESMWYKHAKAAQGRDIANRLDALLDKSQGQRAIQHKGPGHTEPGEFCQKAYAFLAQMEAKD